LNVKTKFWLTTKTMFLKLHRMKAELAKGQNLVGVRLYFSCAGNKQISKDNTWPLFLRCSLFFKANEAEKLISDGQIKLGISISTFH